MSKVFAFNFSMPVAGQPTDLPAGYDVEDQRVVWESGSGSIAYYCSVQGVGYGFTKCEITYSGSYQYCTLSERHYPWVWPPTPMEIVACDPG